MLSVPLFDRLGGGGTIEQRIVGGVVYTRLPTAVLARRSSRRTCAGSASTRTRVGRPRPVGAVAVAGRSGGSARVPRRPSRTTSASSAPSTVRGVATTHYAATIDLGGRCRPLAPHRVARARHWPGSASAIATGRLASTRGSTASGRARRVVVSVPARASSASATPGPLGPQRDAADPGRLLRFRHAGAGCGSPAGQVRPYSALRLTARSLALATLAATAGHGAAQGAVGVRYREVTTKRFLWSCRGGDPRGDRGLWRRSPQLRRAGRGGAPTRSAGTAPRTNGAAGHDPRTRPPRRSPARAPARRGRPHDRGEDGPDRASTCRSTGHRLAADASHCRRLRRDGSHGRAASQMKLNEHGSETPQSRRDARRRRHGLRQRRHGLDERSRSTPPADTLDVPDPTGYLDVSCRASPARCASRATRRSAASPTTRYRATIDLARAAARTTTSAAQNAVADRRRSRCSATSDIPVTVWIDDLGRLRKMQLTMDLGRVPRPSSAPRRRSHPKIRRDVRALRLRGAGRRAGTAPARRARSRDRAGPGATQSDLRNALTAEKTVYTDNQTYDGRPRRT